MPKNKKRKTKVKDSLKQKNRINKQREVCEHEKTEYICIYNLVTFILALIICILSLFCHNQIVIIVVSGSAFFLFLGISCYIVTKAKRRGANGTRHNSLVNFLAYFGTRISFLNPFLLLLCVLANGNSYIKNRNLTKIIVAGIILASIASIYYIFKHLRRCEKSKNREDILNNIEVDDLRNTKKPYYKVVMFFLLIVLIIVAFRICIHLGIISIHYRFEKISSLLKGIGAFFSNNYVANILCTVVTAIVLYFIQIKYSKHKLKKDFRCNEIIEDLYYCIKESRGILTEARRIQKEVDSIKETDFFAKELIEAKKYYDFYFSNKTSLELYNDCITYPNNDILIESIQAVFF